MDLMESYIHYIFYFQILSFNNKADFFIYSESQNLNIMELKQKNIYDKIMQKRDFLKNGNL